MKLSKLMNQTGIFGAGLLLAVSFGASAESIENVNKDIVRSAPFASCVNLDNNQLVTRVKNDFLQNRLPRWQDDKNTLGPKPVASINANEVIKMDNNYQMVLNVRGARTDLRYNVQVNCDDNTITYVSPK
ncbi:protein YebF [Proteus appendicitidis]|uniref:Protein YebF n=1 Tax=Proteus appendicitidis TaxID=3034648 RepID=A0ABY8Y3U2_9GAMM|nr:protein YebF [Proteus sp. HZ0627]WIV87070.1 protein YebF [Proteus sp. HZ0627]